MENNTEQSLTPQVVDQVVELKTFPSLRETIAESIVLFQGYEETLDKEVAALSEAPEVVDKESRKKVKEMLARARSRVKAFEEMRKGITRPLGALQDSARSYEREKIAPLLKAMDDLTTQVKEYDEVVRLAKEKKAKERREQIEREERESKEAVDFARNVTASISEMNLELYRKNNGMFEAWRSNLKSDTFIPQLTVDKYRKQVSKAVKESLTLLDSVEARILEEDRIAAEREKLEAQAAEQAKREAQLKEAEQKQALEAERLEREKREAELKAQQEAQAAAEAKAKREREEAEAERKRQEEAEAIALAEKRKLEQAKADREAILGALASGIDRDKFTITDIAKLDPSLYKIEIRYREVSKLLRETQKPIPGLTVRFNNGLAYKE